MIKIKDTSQFSSPKIKTEKELVDQVVSLKTQGKLIGLCVGGYDLIHPGHMKHLSSAKSLCDILIVGITVDEFNAQRKGKGRPIYSNNLRAYSVSQLASVDFVFLSYYKGAIEVIKSIKPHYYIKGPDYIDDNSLDIEVERQAIRSIGGDIKYTNDEKLSSTEIINYIKNNL